MSRGVKVVWRRELKRLIGEAIKAGIDKNIKNYIKKNIVIVREGGIEKLRGIGI